MNSRWPLKAVMEAELDLPWWRTYAADESEAAVRYCVVGIPVAGNVEHIKEVGAEAKNVLFLPDMEVLEQRHIDLPIPRSTLGAVAGSAKGIGCRRSVCTDPIVGCSCTGRRRGIRSPPVLDRSSLDDHWTVLIGAAKSPSAVVRIAIVRTEDGDGEFTI